MAHMMKYTKAKCGHMFAHFDRSAENIGNENLDRTRTHLNYNLAAHQQISQGEFVRKRCGEVRCQNRKDVNVMVSWIVTAPKDLPEGEQEKFFRSCYDFLCSRYGRENVVSAYVHMDEVQPHMHFAFVPVVPDKKKGGFKVSAKEAVSRRDLQTFHQDLQEHVEHVLGHEVGILNEATREGNRSINELKRQSAEARVQEASLEAARIVSNASKEAQGIKDGLAPLKAEYEAYKAYVEAVGSDFDLLDGVEEQKNIFGKPTGQVILPKSKWETQAVTRMDREAQKKADRIFSENVEAFRKTGGGQKLDALTQRCRELEKNNAALKTENRKLKQSLKAAEKETGEIFNKINRVLSKLPEDIASAFVLAWKQDKIQDRGHDRKR